MQSGSTSSWSVSICVNPVRWKSLSRRDGEEVEDYTNHLEDRGACHSKTRTVARSASGGFQEDEMQGIAGATMDTQGQGHGKGVGHHAVKYLQQYNPESTREVDVMDVDTSLLFFERRCGHDI